MNKVTPEQFEFMSDTSVRHKPTGATFSTYRYVDPENTANTVTENLGRAGERLPNGEEYSAAETRAMAVKLLRERALGEER